MSAENIMVVQLADSPENQKRLIMFLNEMNDAFHIPLATVTDVDSYAAQVLQKGVVLLAEISGRPVGMLCGYANDAAGKTGYISVFGVSGPFRSSGIGRCLLDQFKNACRVCGMASVAVHTHKTNARAVHFYLKHGFKAASTDPNAREDNIYLVCHLTEASPARASGALVTAIGSFSADIVIKTLQSLSYDVVGCDIYPKEWVADAFFVNRFYQAPHAYDRDRYLSFIFQLCARHDVQFVLPLTDPEVDLLSTEKERFLDKGVRVCVSDEKTVALCRDKYRLPGFLIEQGIGNVISTRLIGATGNLECPVFVKPRRGRSSENVRLVHEKKEYELLKTLLSGEDWVVQPYIRGNVLTVDVVRDPVTDDVVCAARRELLRNPSGAGTTVEMIEHPELEGVCREIARCTNITGAVNMEFIESDTGKLYLLEINPRFSAGTVFSHLAGYNIVENHLRCFQGKTIDKKGATRKMVIARKYGEYITRSDISG